MASTPDIYNSLRFVKGQRRHPVSAAHLLHVGNLICINTSTGMAVAGASAASLRCVGRAAQTVDNSAGSAGDLSITVLQEPAAFEISASSAVTIADIGLPVYIENSKTIAKTIGSNAVAAGVLIGISPEGMAIVDQSNL